MNSQSTGTGTTGTVNVSLIDAGRQSRDARLKEVVIISSSLNQAVAKLWRTQNPSRENLEEKKKKKNE